MLVSNSWPTNMQYIGCDEYNSTNSPNRNIDLMSFLVKDNLDTSSEYNLDNITFNILQNSSFNGNSFINFEVDIKAVTIQNGTTVDKKNLGIWSAGINSPLNITANAEIKSLTADIVYRVYTIEV